MNPEHNNGNMKCIYAVLMAAAAACLLLPRAMHAQKGNLFITNYEIEKVLDKQVYSICEDSYHGMLFATKKGILYFDSEEWEVIRVPSIPLVIEKDNFGSRIYVGCRNDIGFLERQPQGHYLYESLLADSINPGNITGIEQTPADIYFYSKLVIIKVNKLYHRQMDFFLPDSSGYFNGFFALNNRIFVNAYPAGIYGIEDAGQVNGREQNFIAGEQILFGLPFDRGRCLVGTDENELYLFDGSQLTPFKIEDQAYLNESYLVSGRDIDGSSFVVSTILGGCLVISKLDGITLYTINYRTGLPDDEIFALGSDANRGIWLSHAYGISRVAPFIPVKNYNTYPGLEGHLFSSTVFNGALYLSTSTGIYKLSEKKQYLEREILVKVPAAEQQPPPADGKPSAQAGEESTKVAVPGSQPEEQAKETQEVEEGLSRRELRKLKRQQKNSEREEKGIPDVREAVKEVSGFFSSLIRTDEIPKTDKLQREMLARVEQPSYKKKKIYSLQSVSHEYTKIAGLDEKSKPLLNCGDRILAGTHAGLYQVVDDRAEPVFKDWYIEFLYLSPSGKRVYAGTHDRVFLISLVDNEWVILKEFDEIGEEIYSVCEVSDDLVWFGGFQHVYRISLSGTSVVDITSYPISARDFEPVFIRKSGDEVLFLQADGIYTLQQDSLVAYRTDHPRIEETPVNHFSDYELLWFLQYNDRISFGQADSGKITSDDCLNLFDKIQDVYFDPQGNIWVIHENTLIDKIVAAGISDYNQLFGIHMKQITNGRGDRYVIGSLDISYRDRSLNFSVIAPCFLKPDATRYRYIIEDLTDEWSRWSGESAITLPVIPPGKHTMRVQAKNVLGQLTPVERISFTIANPFWSSWWFISLLVLCLAGLVLLIIRLRVKKLEHDKKILEQKVRERTAEIERQKNEISAQQKEIMDSIHYAQRIQNAVLPKDRKINELLPENFILFWPRDIVSGDFYWLKNLGDHVVFAAADCTGHGVPGAFMSMLGVSFLNEIVSKGDKARASNILGELRNRVKTTLEQTGREDEQKDGMDIALLIYDRNNRQLQFSGAYNPLYIIRKGELTEIKADRMPIGIYDLDEKPFSNHEVILQKDDCLYVFSDGFADQIGGEKGKKLLSRNLKKLLLTIYIKPMQEQKMILEDRLKEWMGNYQQVDDILMAGIRIG